MKDNSEMTREELIALGWVKNPLDKMQEKTEKLTAVEYILNLVVGTDEQGKDVRVKDTISKSEIAKAKEMEKQEKQEKIDFADKYGTYLLQGGIMSATAYNETFKPE